MEAICYEEQQSFPAWIYAAASVAFVAALALSYRSGTQTNFLAAVLVLLAVGVALWLFSRFHVLVSDHGLQFGFRLFKKNLPLSRIEVGEIRDITFWHGIGIHYMRGTAIWNARLGRGVLVHDGKRRYLVGSDQPERLQSVLYERKAALTKST